VALAASLTANVISGPDTSAATATVLAAALLAYGTGAFLEMPRAALGLAVGMGGMALNVATTTRAGDDLFFGVVVVALMPWVVGRMLRARAVRERAHRELAERLDAERELRAQESALAERARIARELHDVIAHSVSVMVIQAGGARMVMDTEPDRAEASLLQVERAGREALAELRRLVGSLHPADAAALAPQPCLADIDDLIASTRAAGLETDLRVEGHAIGIPPALDLCAYRIVQESLTNAIKHAGPARVSVRLCWLSDALELEVADDGRGPRPGNGHAGHGIDGMSERVAMHGGTLEAGNGPGGGFAVRARLPLIEGVG
jgi:signal transduction histidine kinase